ncbi:hypothetical protein [uncultured Thiodictyon sp.]|uniref:hypothetical protein n=1 Tax=uncultured Thiodictyon sp. TaxID=1846217 RepID=UPI0025F62C76|nr:hypothetical protein [uncultured Thiodictyon sp.]
MVAPREPIRADNPTIVRPLAVALTLLLAAFSGSRAAGPPDSPWDCAGPVGAAGTVPGGGKTWDCRAAETLAGVVAAGPPGMSPAAPPAAGSAALPGAGPADGADGDPDGAAAAVLGPVPAAPESKTEPNTEPDTFKGDEPLPRPDTEVPPPAGALGGTPPGGTPAATADPIPAQPPTPPPPVEPPRPPAWPPGEEPESTRLTLPIPVVVDPARQDYSGPSPWVLPPLDRASPPAADTPRVDAALGALPVAAPRDDYERLLCRAALGSVRAARRRQAPRRQVGPGRRQGRQTGGRCPGPGRGRRRPGRLRPRP